MLWRYCDEAERCQGVEAVFHGAVQGAPARRQRAPDRVGQPHAERMRPRTLEDYVGQEHLLGPGKPLRVEIERDDAGSMILWGTPGVGKTTLATIIANELGAAFQQTNEKLGKKKPKPMRSRVFGCWLWRGDSVRATTI